MNDSSKHPASGGTNGMEFNAIGCPNAGTSGVAYDYPLLRTMAKNLIQQLMLVQTIEAAELRYSLVRLSIAIAGWTPQKPPSDKDKHRVVNETIETLLRAQELLKFNSTEADND